MTYVLISANGLVDVAGRKLVQLLVVAENDHGDINRAKDRQLVSLLEEASFAFEKGAGWLFVSTTELWRRRCKFALTPTGSYRP